MGLWKAINKGLHNINEVGTKTVAPAVGKVINKGLKKAPDVIESGAGILNTGIKKIQSTIGKIKNGEAGRAISEGAGKVARTVLADDSSYKHAINVGNKGVQWSNKPLVLDQLSNTTKSYLYRGAAVFDSISKDKVNVPFTNSSILSYAALSIRLIADVKITELPSEMIPSSYWSTSTPMT